MGDAAPKQALRSAQSHKTAQEVSPQLLGAVRAAVGELPLREGPHRLVRVQLRRVGRKVLEPQPWEGRAQLANGRPLVNLSPIPDHDDRAAEVTQQVPEEFADLRLADVLAVQVEVESEPPAPGAHRDAGDDRDPVVALPEAQEWRLAAGGPGSADAGDEQEAAFVYEDEVGAQPRGVFFIRGQSFSFHRVMACSSRWSARLSGFCGVQPS